MAEYKLSYTANEIDEKLKRIKEGNVGYTEDGKVYTFNGDTTGKTVIDNLAKISDDAPDLKNVTKTTVTLSDGMVVEILPDNLVVNKYDNGVQELTDNRGILLAASVQVGDDETPAGLYAYAEPIGYVSRIEFAETIHPIDTKYIPDTIARVADLPNAGGSGSAISEEELLELLVEMDVVQPISNASNALYTDENNIVYVL